MLRIYLFGPPRLLLDDTPLPVASRPNVLPLLAYLVLRARVAVSRERIARTFWPDDEHAAARANVRRHLHYVRALLPARNRERWIAASAGALQWNCGMPFWCDVLEFERCERAADGFANAVALHAGEFLEGCDRPWVEFERESYRIAYLRALEHLVVEGLGRRDYGNAERHAKLLLLHDPWRETAVRALMQIRFEAGDRAGAIVAYERFAARLRDELQTLPMPDTEAAYRALLDGLLPHVVAPRPPLPARRRARSPSPLMKTGSASSRERSN